MKRVIVIAAFAAAMSFSNTSSAQNMIDIGLPFIPVPIIENADIALPDMESDVKEPAKETSMKSEAILNEDKTRKEEN